MDNKDILLLKTLYEEKNITHTAKRLFLSQPALTDRLKRLEAEFGCTLFLRQPRGIQFTSEGELLYRFFLQMESSYQKIRDSLSDARIHPAGTLSIACSNVFAKYHMPRILTQFRKTYPRIEIHMKSGFSHDGTGISWRESTISALSGGTTTGTRKNGSCGRIPSAPSAGSP